MSLQSETTKPERNALQDTTNASPYDDWLRSPTQANMSRVLDDVSPTINTALTTYGGTNVSPILRSRAKLLAVKAIKNYDPSRGASLKSHIMLQLQPLRRYNSVAAQPMKISERRLRQMYMLNQAEKELSETTGRDPSDAELADKLGLSIKKINKIRTLQNPYVSTEGGADPNSVDPVVYQSDQEDAWIEYVYHDLSDIDRKILDWKLGRGGQPILRNVEIARKLKLSPAAVTQRINNIHKKLAEGIGVSV